MLFILSLAGTVAGLFRDVLEPAFQSNGKSTPDKLVLPYASPELVERLDALDPDLRRNLLSILDERGVPIGEREELLTRLLDNYENLSVHLSERVDDEPQWVEVYRSIQKGDFEVAAIFLGRLEQLYSDQSAEADVKAAEVSFMLGEVKEIQLQYELAQAAYSRAVSLNPGEPRYLLALGDLALLTGEYAQAEEVFQQLLQLEHTTPSKGTSFMSQAYSGLGSAAYFKGEYRTAIDYHGKALDVDLAVEGETSGNVATDYNNIAAAMTALGDFDAARDLHLKALAIKKHLFGEQHSSVAASYNNLGVLASEQGHHGEARSWYEKALAIHRKVHGPTHPYVALTLTDLGISLTGLGEYREALKYQVEGLRLRERLYGPLHVSLGQSHNALGYTFEQLGQYEDALAHHRKALAIRLRSQRENHPEVGISLVNVGTSLWHLSQHEEALEKYEQAMPIFKGEFGEGHPNVGVLHSYICRVLKGLGRLDEALANCEAGLELVVDGLGPESERAGDVFRLLGQLYGDLEDANRAQEFFRRAAAVFTRVLGEDHKKTRETRDEMERVRIGKD